MCRAGSSSSNELCWCGFFCFVDPMLVASGRRCGGEIGGMV